MKAVATLLLTVFVCCVSADSQTVRGKRTPPRTQVKGFVATNPVSQLPIKRVILYSNGVAYIERRGFVNGNAQVDLSFKQSQVDDVLKSMVVLDLNQGKIGAVSYNSSSSASARTAEIPFSVDAASGDSKPGGIAEVLSQLQGARVLVTSTKGTAAGAILTVEKRVVPAEKEKPASTAHFLVVSSETGEISSFDLADVRSVKLLDEGTKRDLSEFANATASTRRRDAKTITVTSEGSGQRELVVSYTIAAPIWKTTYRVVLDQEGKPFFQGWAIVDNVSEENWSGVQLSLISGSPVSFIQNLQKPLYRYRPIIPIPEDLNLTPQIYDPEAGYGEGSGSGSGNGSGNGSGYGAGGGVGIQTSPTKALFEGANNNFIVSSGFAGSSVSDAMVNERSGVETAAVGEEIGDLFEYKIEQPVSVERNRSALIPIIQTKMEGERVSIFREQKPDSEEDDDSDEDDETEAVRKANPRPMSGMLLKNVTGMTFEGGSLTVLDGDAYAGEALMERLKPKEQRLISFALDLGTLMRVEQKEDREPARIVKVVNGVFQAHYFKTDKKIYRLTNQTDKPRTVYIEHPVRKDWVLSDRYAKPDYTTARFYRFRIELKGFESKEVTVAENLGMMDKYNLTDLSPKDLDVFVASKFIDEPTRVRLAKLIDLRMRINEINAKLEQSEQESDAISKDQERFRENIEALAKTPEAKQLIGRYIAKANEQESRLEEISKSRQSMTTEKDQLERELATEIKNFELK
ncbi:MAG TPA: hypothetical protein VJV05_18020 [Pyrinomonadaceae bacterium]|nr:hypothetical protein [Pyrinomonadaceae bacterium]